MSEHEQALAAQIKQDFANEDAFIAEIIRLRKVILDFAINPVVLGVLEYEKARREFNAK